MTRYFPDSKSLMDYVRANEVFQWHGDYALSNLEFIDSDFADLHVVFDSRADYNRWKEGVDLEPCQLRLF